MEGNITFGKEQVEAMEISTSDAPAVAIDQTSLATADAGLTLLDNPDDMTCYCGKDRDMAAVDFQCGMCLRFYHADCMTSNTKPCVPFMTNYTFFCKRCDSNGQEIFSKRQASFSQMCHTAVSNLTLQNPNAECFSKDKAEGFCLFAFLRILILRNIIKTNKASFCLLPITTTCRVSTAMFA
ncbi:hypothetical protein LSAT2_028542 [Lamellibrachia satsuma]|nr:hypothetical protein LSAT2_028542 [Lamellibrachia satsuma]